MRRTNLSARDCPVARALDVIGDPWTMLVVRDLFLGKRRFAEIQRSLEIPRATLVDRLERLIEHGVIERGPGSARPEYRLTEQGKDLRPVVLALKGWGERWTEPAAEVSAGVAPPRSR